MIRQVVSRFGVRALLSIGLFLAAQGDAEASCPSSRRFITDPIQLMPSVQPDAVFWALGSGDPVRGAEVDSGSVNTCNWAYSICDQTAGPLGQQRHRCGNVPAHGRWRPGRCLDP